MIRPASNRLPSWALAWPLAAALTLALVILSFEGHLTHAQSAPAQTVDWQTSPLDLDLRGMNGEQYTFLCPSGRPQPSRVAGSGPYTDDSSICAAAVHAGAIHPKTGGTVTIEIRPGQKTFLGSAQNYITSTTYDHAWSGGFVVLANDIAGSKSAPTN